MVVISIDVQTTSTLSCFSHSGSNQARSVPSANHVVLGYTKSIECEDSGECANINLYTIVEQP